MKPNFVTILGRFFLHFLEVLGRLTLFTGAALRAVVTPVWYGRQITRQMVEIGYYSLPVVGLTAIFTGAVLALQSYTGFQRSGIGAESSVASIVIIAITRELGPVLAALMVAGRIGASIAAEIGTMRVTEQIDALATLSTNPYKYLIAPRILAAVLMLPCLVAIADSIGVYGGYLAAVHKLGFHETRYLQETIKAFEWKDMFSGLVKAAAFGFIITLMGCYHGFHSGKGAQGVGQATTNAVVSASILILCFNYIITQLFFGT